MLSYLSKTLLLLLNVNYFNYFRLYFHLYILLNSFILVLAIFISLLLQFLGYFSFLKWFSTFASSIQETSISAEEI